MSNTSKPESSPTRLVVICIASAVVCGGLYLWTRSLAAERAARSQQKYDMMTFGLAYHGYHSSQGVGPPDLSTMRNVENPGFWLANHDPKAHSVVDEWIESGRLEVVWNGDFDAVREAGRSLDEFYIARERPPSGATEGLAVMADGAIVRLPRSELESLEPLLTSK